MDRDALRKTYRGYIDCLNARDWQRLDRFVGAAVRYNGAVIGLEGYRAMLRADVAAIPDLRFEIATLVADPPVVASRLLFDCTPVGMLFGLPVNGRHLHFEENVFYTFADGRIDDVRSIIDKAAIAAQL
ncbi:ester cyclase (plasmid) [Salipiger sp. H15]|uniref:Ester cyclase n=1 Tax=Alloyangia sp. H15 TaxID=3029062 RepID=A0AAU8AQH0_9RHOB